MILIADSVKALVMYSNDSSQKWLLVSKFYTGPYTTPQNVFVEVLDNSGLLFLGAVYINKFYSPVLQKTGDSLYVMGAFSGLTSHPFKNKLFQYFSDCRDVEPDVRRYYKMRDNLDQLVKKYNQLCGRKKE